MTDSNPQLSSAAARAEVEAAGVARVDVELVDEEAEEKGHISQYHQQR